MLRGQGLIDVSRFQLRVGLQDPFTAAAAGDQPTTVPTVMRSPRMQGLPHITAGSWLMRGKAIGQE